MNFHHVAVAQDFGPMHLLALEPAVPPQPREFHPLGQIAVNLLRQVGNRGAERHQPRRGP